MLKVDALETRLHFLMLIRGMLELNERYSDVSVKVMVIKSAKGDVPNDGNIWQNNSANKLLDTFNTERFTILKSKFIKMKAPSMSIQAVGVSVCLSLSHTLSLSLDLSLCFCLALCSFSLDFYPDACKLHIAVVVQGLHVSLDLSRSCPLLSL